MKKVTRDEILSLGAYEEIREHFRRRILGVKAERRLHVGPVVTILFENHDTILYQIQEMLRTERITAEPDVRHEIETYNELLPEGVAIGGTLMVEEPDAARRPALLASLRGLHEHVHLRLGEARIAPTWFRHDADESEQISSVQYLAFPLGEHAAALLRDDLPAALEITHPGYRHLQPLSAVLRRALAADLAAA